MADINGTAEPDVLNGTSGADNINGSGGNDAITGGDGDDSVSGGQGNDTIDGGEGNDSLFGNGGGGIDGNDVIHGGNGNDTIHGSGGNDQLFGDDGDDTISTETSSGSVFGGLGNDTISLSSAATSNADGGAGIDRIGFDYFGTTTGVMIDLTNLWLGGAGIGPGAGVISAIEQFVNFAGSEGNDSFTLGSGYTADTVLGGVFMINGYGGNDSLTGGNGVDWIKGGNGDDSLQGLSGNDFLAGEDGSDVLRGGLGNDTLSGINGNDTLFGDDGSDNITGGLGDDVLFGGDGNDILYGNGGGGTGGRDILAGGAGNDRLIGSFGGSAEFIGGFGDDTYEISATTTGEAVLNTLFEVSGEGIDEVRASISVFSLEWFGSSELERLTVADDANHGALIGNAIANTITGGTGTDGMFGRGGDDTLYGGSGAANTLVGNAGNDIYVVAAVGDSVIEFAGEGTDTVRTALGSFVLRDQVENLDYTGAGSFIGVGNGQANLINGGIADDQLNGMGGDDILIGRSGADLMQGGAGADQFRYAGDETGLDRILDFVSGADKIALSSTGFVRTTTVDFIQSGAPAATSTNSTFLYNLNNGIVSYDADGTGAGAAVQIAQLNAGLTLAATDFIFY